MDDYLAQTDRTLRSLTSLEQSKASSATLNYAQGEAARAAAAEIRAGQAEREAAAARQRDVHAQRLQSEGALQSENKLREGLASAESELYRAMNRIRALEVQLAQVRHEAQAKIQSLKRARKGVFQALA